LNKRELYTKCGTPSYVDPELLDGRHYRAESDIFSIGCIFFNLVSGQQVYIGADIHQILDANQFSDGE